MTPDEMCLAANEISSLIRANVILSYPVDGEACTAITPELTAAHRQFMEEDGDTYVIPTTRGPVYVRPAADGGIEFPAVAFAGLGADYRALGEDIGRQSKFVTALLSVAPSVVANCRYARKFYPPGTIPSICAGLSGEAVVLKVELLRRGGDFRDGLTEETISKIGAFEAQNPDGVDYGVFIECNPGLSYANLASPRNAATFDAPRAVLVGEVLGEPADRVYAISHDDFAAELRALSAKGQTLWAHVMGPHPL